jgi:hypothetical protein
MAGASDHKVGSPINVWQSLANRIVGKGPWVREQWDKVGEIVRLKHDSLCQYIDDFIATKDELQQIILGQIVDGTITNAKLATDVKIGSLVSLATTVKDSVVNAINELANGSAKKSIVFGSIPSDTVLASNMTTVNKFSIYSDWSTAFLFHVKNGGKYRITGEFKPYHDGDSGKIAIRAYDRVISAEISSSDHTVYTPFSLDTNLDLPPNSVIAVSVYASGGDSMTVRNVSIKGSLQALTDAQVIGATAL